MLVEDALGSTDFQTRLLPSLVARAIDADNSALVEILLPYAEDEHKVLALANRKDDAVKHADEKDTDEKAGAGTDAGGSPAA